MRKFLYTIVALTVALLTTSCLYGVGSDEGVEIKDTSGFKVEVSATVISANGEDTAVFRALYNGEDVTAQCTVYNENNEAVELADMSFSTYIAGNYYFYLVYGEEKSELITIQAVQDFDLSDKEERGLTVALSTNLVQVGQHSAAFIIRHNGKVLLPEEMQKVKIYNAEDNSPVTLEYMVYQTTAGVQYILPTYTATETGTKSFWVMYNIENTRETPVSITAVATAIPSSPVDAEPENTNFVHRTLFTQFTGTWCGNCPYMIAAFHHLFEDATYKDKFIHTAVHNNDAFATTLSDGRDLSSILNTTGNYPYVLMDLTTGISNRQVNANISNLMGAIESDQKTPARAAIAARTELKDNMLVIRASVKVSHAGEYFIGAWLVESNLSAHQSNYTDIKEDYIDIHENVVRIADSYSTTGRHFLGHSVGNVNAGERADHLFVMELNPSWKTENCHLVLFASTVQFNALTMTNAVKTTSLTSGVDFEYKK